MGHDGQVLLPIAALVSRFVACTLAALMLAGWPVRSDAGPARDSPVAGAPDPTSGPLFYAGIGHPHGCSATVIASASRDLVLTAAHCITGSGAGVQFAPGYDGGKTPFGVWTAARVYADPSWISHQDPAHDMAILKMRPQQRDGRRVGVEDVVGANLLGLAPPNGTPVAVPAYPSGINDKPVSCLTRVYRTGGYPAFDCAGYPGGTSGAPFLQSVASSEGRRHDHLVVGVIGGLHQGGCSPDTSYSAPFRPDVYRLWMRATLGSAPDVLPQPGSSGC
jgi:hypothetical protein